LTENSLQEEKTVTEFRVNRKYHIYGYNLIKAGMLAYHWKILGEGFPLIPQEVSRGCS
jgi:hypothetical protein